VSDEAPRQDGPTEVVETEEGELIERLSGGTATLLLVWLIGVGALSTLLAGWLYFLIVTGQRLGPGVLFSGAGLYLSLAGAAGPCVLWLAGRAQGHALGWFMWTGAKIALVMVAIVLIFVFGAAAIMGGVLPGPGALLAAVVLAVLGVILAQVWALATWGADRWIARARTES
jgi:hypothetical protein